MIFKEGFSYGELSFMRKQHFDVNGFASSVFWSGSKEECSLCIPGQRIPDAFMGFQKLTYALMSILS